MPFKIVRNNITAIKAETFVNLAKDRQVLTSGLAEEILHSYYQKWFALAWEKGSKSLAIPFIPATDCEYPKEEGMRIALDEIGAFLLQHEMMIYLVFEDSAGQERIKQYLDLEHYINQNYVDAEKKRQEMNFMRMERFLKQGEKREQERQQMTGMPLFMSRGGASFSVSAPTEKSARESTEADTLKEDAYDAFIEENEKALDERLGNLSNTFQEYLLNLINEKNMTNAEVYKRAIITKQLFSKIKLNPEYHPDKSTAMRLCVGAKLNPVQTKELLARAGYALSPCDKRDVIFQHFIEEEMYDMIEIDIVLEERGLECFIE